uniref:Uncharacterized protein n=1 Tax=Mammaliicoccus phage MSShimriz1 TaxID=3230127 RepID=A0AAU8GV29_9VIRU
MNFCFFTLKPKDSKCLISISCSGLDRVNSFVLE